MLSAFSKIKTPVGAPASTVALNGKWVNELGSTMDLKVDADGHVKGVYRTAKGEPPEWEECDLRGFATGDLVAFSVNFGRYATLTSWVGQHTDQGRDAAIKTMWILAKNVEDSKESDALWGAALTGYNNYTR